MSASAYPPEALAIIDPGTAPEYFVTGMALYTEANGIVRTAFYTEQPVIDPGEEEVRSMKVVVVRLVYTAQAQERMRQQIVDLLTAPRDTAFRAGIMGLPS